MYKIIFVDDEAIIRNGISRCVPWEELGFELDGVFEHGQQALSYIEEHHVDVVLSDINMPKMSGLELSGILGERFPDVVVILLTGYDDFEYAQAAIRHQVREFILKPITRTELSKVLETIGTELDRVGQQKKEQELLQARVDQSFPLLKERYLRRLISDSAAVNSLAQRAEYYQWQDRGGWYQIMMAAVPLSWTELERMALVEYLEGQINPHDEVFTSRKGEIIVLAQDRDPDLLDSFVRSLAKGAFDFSAGMEKVVVSLGCGEPVDSLSFLEISYKGACAALDYSRSLGLSQIVAIADIKDKEAPSPAILAKMQLEIVEHLKDGMADESLEMFRKMVVYLEEHYQSSKQLAMTFIGLFSRIFAFIQDMDLDLPDENGGMANLVQLETLAQGEIFFDKLIRHVGDRISQRRNDVLLSRIDKAKSIIRENYGDKSFSLQDICRELYLSTSQFSVLFKEGTDQTFVEYLTSVRMDEAKKLLASTDLKSYEIAESVGYSDPRYFSITFKKHCGMTAMEYRRSRSA